MAIPSAPQKPPLRPPPPMPQQMKAGPPPVGQASRKTFTSAAPEFKAAYKIGIYGTGGVGKTSLAMNAPAPVKFIDLDDSTGLLAPVDGVSIVKGVECWQDLLDALRQDDLWKGVRSIVIDTATKAEEMSLAHVIGTKGVSERQAASSIEDYGYGKGYKYHFENYLALFAELDRHNRLDRNVILICHDITQKVPNPAGVDYIRWSPRLQQNIADKMKEWCDHLFYIKYDFTEAAIQAKGSLGPGKNLGGNSRTIYAVEQSTFVAKSRTLKDPIPYVEGDVALWDALFARQ